MTTTLDLLAAHPFLDGLAEAWLRYLSFQARRTVHHGGSRLFREGDPAEHFWLIRDGRVSLEFTVPGRGDIVIEELGPGTVLGWSWMFPSGRWQFSAVAAEQTLAIEIDAREVQRLCDNDPAFGYEITRRFSAVLADRLQAARMRLLQVYAYPGRPIT
jgi:CRP-like cAMP-binding protein